jgi:hypothetical protein
MESRKLEAMVNSHAASPVAVGKIGAIDFMVAWKYWCR